MDASGGKRTVTDSVVAPDSIALTFVNTDFDCATAGGGSIDLSVAGGAGTFTYSWSTGAINEDISSLIPGNYSVTVTDQNGCIQTDSSLPSP